MKIKLIQPRTSRRPMDSNLKARMSPSLALYTLRALTPSEHSVVVENENIREIDFDAPADLVGITVTVDVFPRAVEIAKRFRAKGIPVVVGGIHITANPETAVDFFDALCLGAAERSWPKILQDVQKNDLRKIYDDNVDFSGDEIASPDYEAMNDEEYLCTNVLCASRGCPFQCDFCYNAASRFRRSRVVRPVEAVLAEIARMKTRHVMFIDDNFIGDPDWTKRFLSAVRPLNLKWNAAVSANVVQNLDLLDLMAETGCQSLFIGFESLSDEAIQGVRKRQNNIARFEELVRKIHDREIMINASFVFGLDGDDPSVFPKTLDWIVRNRIETATSHILTPYPGTPLYRRFLAEGRILDFDLARYDTANVVFQPKNMSPQELLDGYLWLYRQGYSLRNIFRRRPKNWKQQAAYWTFNLIYRKWGRITEKFCERLSYRAIGKAARFVSYRMK